MKRELDEMVNRFRASQDRAVATLIDTLKIPLALSNLGWASYCLKYRLDGMKQLSGIPFRPHGYGIEMEVDGINIDFDWGDAGQPDGFDGWRLWWHFSTNNWETPGTHSQVNAWLETVYAEGELQKQSTLYYDPNRRWPRQ